MDCSSSCNARPARWLACGQNASDVAEGDSNVDGARRGLVTTMVGGLGGRWISLALALGEWSAPLTALRGVEHTGQAVGALASAFGVLASRLWQWSAGRLGGQPVNDPVALMLAWAATFWGVGAWAAWHIRRRSQVAHALAPTAAVLVAEPVRPAS